MEEGVLILPPGRGRRLPELSPWGKTNSTAYEQFYSLLMRATSLTGHSFDPSGRTIGITPMLERLLTQAELKDIGTRAHAINFSMGAVAHQAMYQNFRVFFKLVQPFMLKTRNTFPQAGIPGQEELDRLYERTLLEAMEDDFVAIFYLLTAWGVKP